MTRSKSIDKDDDNHSNKSTTSLSKSPSSNAVGGTPRRTPAQVKADSNAKKSKTPVKTPSSTPIKSPMGKKDFVSSSTSIEEKPPKSTSPDLTPKYQTEEATPDIISGGGTGEGQRSPVKDKSPPPSTIDGGQENAGESGPGTPSKKIISSEEEAKAKLAEKRREMKEKMEREAELERQRLAEEERLEEERRLKEEEEERLAMIEADRLAALARQAEEERLQKAMAEAQKREEEERQRKEEEEKAKKEKEEAERKAREEAEIKQKELEEKHRKEEAERLERKKRIEQIMARTRGSKGTPTSTPKKEVATPQSESDAVNGTTPLPEDGKDENGFHSSTQHHSGNADSTFGNQTSSPVSATPQPDLLGDLFSNNNKQQSNALASPTSPSSVLAENEKNQFQDASPNKQLLLDSPEEKGTIDTQIKEESAADSNGQSHGNGNHEFDQILDLSEVKESSVLEVTAAPIIAFEAETTNDSQESGASSSANKLDANTADLLSWKKNEALTMLGRKDEICTDWASSQSSSSSPPLHVSLILLLLLRQWNFCLPMISSKHFVALNLLASGDFQIFLEHVTENDRWKKKSNHPICDIIYVLGPFSLAHHRDVLVRVGPKKEQPAAKNSTPCAVTNTSATTTTTTTTPKYYIFF